MARWILGMTCRGKISEPGLAHLQSGWKGHLGEDREVRHNESLCVKTGYMSYFSKVLIINTWMNKDLYQLGISYRSPSLTERLTEI